MTITPMDHLSSLISAPYAPAFIHLHHPHHPTTSIARPYLQSALDGQANAPSYAQVDLIELNTPKLLYSAILHRLASVDQGSGSGSHGGKREAREASSWDEFAQGLREVMDAGGVRNGKRSTAIESNGVPRPGGGGHEKQAQPTLMGIKRRRAVIMITHAERLRSVLGSRWAGIARAGELIGLPITVITASQQTWDHLRPYAADAPEPVHVFLPAPSRSDLSSTLIPYSDRGAYSTKATNDLANPFLSAPEAQIGGTHPLWPHFCNLLLASFAHLAPTAAELSFLAEPLWTLYTAKLSPHAEQHFLRQASRFGNAHGNGSDGDANLQPLDITVKLLTDLKYAISPAFASATESLLWDGVGRSTFLTSLLPTSLDPSQTDGLDNPLAGPSKRSLPRAPSVNVPYVAKFLLIASYLASQNPPRTDLRLFGRGLTADGKRKKGGGTRRAGYGRVKVGKVPQRLLGPKPFPLERGLAIWAALYAENAKRPADLEEDDQLSGSEDELEEGNGEAGEDEEEVGDPTTPSKRRSAANGSASTSVGLPRQPKSAEPQAKRIMSEDWLYSRAERESKRAERKRQRQIEREERWEEYVDEMSMSVALWGLIPDLEGQGLIKRVSPPERLDNVQIRCEIGYEAAVSLAKEVGLVLDEYLYEAQA